jgi:hypothetical protein
MSNPTSRPLDQKEEASMEQHDVPQYVDVLRDLQTVQDMPAPPSKYEVRLRTLDPETIQEIDAALREPLPEPSRRAVMSKAEQYLGIEIAKTETRRCWNLWGFSDQDQMRDVCKSLGDFARRINKPVYLLNKVEELHIAHVASCLGRPVDEIEAVYYGGDQDYGSPVHNLWWHAPMPPAGKEPSVGVAGLLRAAILYQASCAALAEGCDPAIVCSEWAEELHAAAEAVVAWRVSLCNGEEPDLRDWETSGRGWSLVWGDWRAETRGDNSHETQ